MWILTVIASPQDLVPWRTVFPSLIAAFCLEITAVTIICFFKYNIESYPYCSDNNDFVLFLSPSVRPLPTKTNWVIVSGWPTDWRTDRWIQRGILLVRQRRRWHNHHQGVGNSKYPCKFYQSPPHFLPHWFGKKLLKSCHVAVLTSIFATPSVQPENAQNK